MKWMGAFMVTFGCAGLGRYWARQWRLRLRWMEQLRQMMYFLKGEILYGHASLGTALDNVGKRCQKAAGERGYTALPSFFQAVAQRICRQEGEAFADIWKEELAFLKGTPLKDEDISALENMGFHLGYLDLAMQERNLLLYIEQLDGQIAYLQMHLRERTKLYASLGIMGGLFLSVAML